MTHVTIDYIQQFVSQSVRRRMIRSAQAESLRLRIEHRMLSGEPFSYPTLCAEFRKIDRRLYEDAGGSSFVSLKIQQLRKAEQIAGEKNGRGFIWRKIEEAK